MWDAAAIHVLPELPWERLVPQPCHGERMGWEKPSGNGAAPGAGGPCHTPALALPAVKQSPYLALGTCVSSREIKSPISVFSSTPR